MKSRSSEGNVLTVQNSFAFAPFCVKRLDVVTRKALILVPFIWGVEYAVAVNAGT
jgi:hypothetical protein